MRVPLLAHYALATRNTDLAVFLLKVMIDVNLATFEAHNGTYARIAFVASLSLSF